MRKSKDPWPDLDPYRLLVDPDPDPQHWFHPTPPYLFRRHPSRRVHGDGDAVQQGEARQRRGGGGGHPRAQRAAQQRGGRGVVPAQRGHTHR
jgi:hypothetical protein